MATREQIESFHKFAFQQIDNGGADLSMQELFELWRVKHPSAEELAESVAAVNAAYDDVAAGESGRPSRGELRETCSRLGLVIDE